MVKSINDFKRRDPVRSSADVHFPFDYSKPIAVTILTSSGFAPGAVAN